MGRRNVWNYNVDRSAHSCTLTRVVLDVCVCVVAADHGASMQPPRALKCEGVLGTDGFHWKITLPDMRQPAPTMNETRFMLIPVVIY